MTIIPENTQIDTPAVVSMFDARKRRYDQAIATYNAWFESDTRCECSYVDSVISDLELIEAIEERERELFDTPAHTLADVAFKVQLSIYEMDDCPDDWKPAKQNLKRYTQMLCMR